MTIDQDALNSIPLDCDNLMHNFHVIDVDSPPPGHGVEGEDRESDESDAPENAARTVWNSRCRFGFPFELDEQARIEYHLLVANSSRPEDWQVRAIPKRSDGCVNRHVTVQLLG